MNDDIEQRLRTGLTALAKHARSEPSRSLTLEDASDDGPSHSRLRRLTAAAAVACVAAGAAVLLTWDRGDDPDSSPAPTTEATAPPSGTLLPPIDGCPADRPGDWSLGTHPSADYLDFVKLNGLMYEGDSTGQMDTRTGSLTRSQLGQRLGVVCFTLSEIKADLDAPLQDGDASFVPRGTELYAIKRSDPQRRIAAELGDRLAVYEVREVPGAATGADVLDLSSGFDSIVVRIPAAEPVTTLPPGAATTQVPPEPRGVVEDAAVVRTLIDDLGSSPVRARQTGIDDGDSYVVELHRTDGTVTPLSFHPGTSVLRPQGWEVPAIVVPDSWGDAVEDALAPNERNVTLYVSNQSFEDDPVHITVTIDGEAVVDDDFFVEGQHNWVSHELELEPGTHVLTATSNTGATLTRTIRIPESEPRWMVVDYWYYPDDPGQPGSGEPRFFTFNIDDEPILFD